MKIIITQLVAAFFGALGYSLLHHLRKELLFLASFGGFLSWGIYLFGIQMNQSVFFSCFLASAFAALYAEILARIKKAPTTLFLVPGIIPAVPGGSLYYTMSSIVQGEWELAKQHGFLTIEYTLAIASGISLVWAFCIMLQNINKSSRR